MGLEEIRLSYAIELSGEQSLATRKPDELSNEDWMLLQTGADMVKTSQGLYQLISSYTDNDPPGRYLTYGRTTASNRLTRPNLEVLQEEGKELVRR